ncbi:hypothetical protein HDU81_002785 [Chytriomyces hyalinus]|nr:hypothetical protein HDU81_002785 [Chytriomyces hyalinus]
MTLLRTLPRLFRSTPKQSTSVRFGSSHSDHHHHEHFGGEPTGYFLGAPGKTGKKGKYFWEPVWVWGYLGGTAVFLVAYSYSPNKTYVLSNFTTFEVGSESLVLAFRNCVWPEN